MPLHRERTDPIRTPDDLGLVHRRWVLPDDVHREVGLAAVAGLWHALFDLRILDRSQEVLLYRQQLPGGSPDVSGLPAVASAGAILAGASSATAVSQVVYPEEGFRDPYLVPGGGYRDYTLYAIESPRFLFLPLGVAALVCGSCGKERPVDPASFSDGNLLDLERTCPSCGAATSADSDRVRLGSGPVFLLGEASARTALSIELPGSPPDEEMPDAEVASAIEAAFGPTDELADEGVEPA
jgi:hypothetical protein